MRCKQGDGVHPQSTRSPYLPYTYLAFHRVPPFHPLLSIHSFPAVSGFWLAATVAAKKRGRNMSWFLASQALRSTTIAKGGCGTETQLPDFAGGIPKLCFSFLQLTLYKWLQVVFRARLGCTVKDQGNSRTQVNVLPKEGTGSENKAHRSEHAWVRLHLGGVQEKG